MAAFRKFVMASGKGMAVEAVMKFQRQSEQTDKDGGEYLTWLEVLGFFNKDAEQATRFCNQRRGQPSGTAFQCRLLFFCTFVFQTTYVVGAGVALQDQHLSEHRRGNLPCVRTAAEVLGDQEDCEGAALSSFLVATPMPF